jgi:hypothetical protein
LTGASPAGFRAPYWSVGPTTLDLVEAVGFRYDSSLMAHDYDLYRIRHGDRHSIVDGSHWGRRGALVEVPVYWAMDDWPHFEPGPGRPGLAAPSAVLEIWTEELRYAQANAPVAWPRAVHPECIAWSLDGDARTVHRDAASPSVVFERLDTLVCRWRRRTDGLARPPCPAPQSPGAGCPCEYLSRRRPVNVLAGSGGGN